MERLLRDAEKISGIKYDISSYSDVVQAIHVMQESMGIAGTTAKEAASTIEGSISMMKGAWQNLVVGMARSDADMDVLINNFVESTAIAAQNLLPRIEQMLMGICTLIEKMAPIIAEALPQLVEKLLPAVISAGASLLNALGNAIVETLPAIGEMLLSGLETILTDVFGMSETKATEFSSRVRGAFSGIGEGFSALVESAQTEGTWLNEVFTGIQETAAAWYEMLIVAYDALVAGFKWLVEQANTDGTLLSVIWENIKTTISMAIEFAQGVIKMFTQVLQGDWSGAWETCKNIASTVWDAICSIISNIVDWISGFLGTMVEKGIELINSLAEGIQNKFAELFTLVGTWVTDNIITPIADMGKNLYEAGVSLLNEFWDGLTDVWDKIKDWWDGLTFPKKKAPEIEGDGTPHATGLNFVPFDGYPAILHRGEAVLTSAEARVWRNGGYGATPAMAGGITINQYIQSVPQTPVDLANATEAYFEQARWML